MWGKPFYFEWFWFRKGDQNLLLYQLDQRFYFAVVGAKVKGVIKKRTKGRRRGRRKKQKRKEEDSFFTLWNSIKVDLHLCLVHLRLLLLLLLQLGISTNSFVTLISSLSWLQMHPILHLFRLCPAPKYFSHQRFDALPIFHSTIFWKYKYSIVI